MDHARVYRPPFIERATCVRVRVLCSRYDLGTLDATATTHVVVFHNTEADYNVPPSLEDDFRNYVTVHGLVVRILIRGARLVMRGGSCVCRFGHHVGSCVGSVRHHSPRRRTGAPAIDRRT